MTKYLIQTLKGNTAIIQCTVRPVTLLEDPSLGWSLRPGEAKYQITAPKSMEQDQTYSWALFDSLETALERATDGLTEEAERTAWKTGEPFDDLKLSLKVAAIQVKYL